MKAKYGTSLRDCAMWLHVATGTRLTASAFGQKYKIWIRNIRKERREEVKAKKEAMQKTAQNYINKNYTELKLELKDERDIAAVAENEARSEEKKS